MLDKGHDPVGHRGPRRLPLVAVEVEVERPGFVDAQQVNADRRRRNVDDTPGLARRVAEVARPVDQLHGGGLAGQQADGVGTSAQPQRGPGERQARRFAQVAANDVEIARGRAGVLDRHPRICLALLPPESEWVQVLAAAVVLNAQDAALWCSRPLTGGDLRQPGGRVVGDLLDHLGRGLEQGAVGDEEHAVRFKKRLAVHVAVKQK